MNLATIVRNGFALVTVAAAIGLMVLAAGCGQSTPQGGGQEKPLLAGKPVELPAPEPEQPSADTGAGKPAPAIPAPLPPSATDTRPPASPIRPAGHQVEASPLPPPALLSAGSLGAGSSGAGPAGVVQLGVGPTGANPPSLANPLRSGSSGRDEGGAEVQAESPPAPQPAVHRQAGPAVDTASASSTDTVSGPAAGTASTLTSGTVASPSLTSGTVASPQQGSELILRVPGQQAKSAGEGRPASAENRPPAAVGRLRPSNRSTAPFDPIKENGPIFEGWPKPQVALVITGRQEGYLEPCGCAGLETMKGGMSRRYTLFQTLRKEKGWPVVGLDVGDIAKGFGPQAELKFQTAVEGMRMMGYDAITLGCTDLRLPAGLLTSVVAAEPSPFVSANVGLFGFAAKIVAPYRIVEAGGKKFGITGVLGKSCQKQIHNTEIEMSDPETALKKILPEMKQKADYLILLANATPEELAKALPEFDLVVTSGGPAEPPAQPAKLNGGRTLLVEVGEKGENAVVVGFFADAKHPMRCQRVPLDSRFAASRAMKQLMAGYQDQLKNFGFAGLGIRPATHPQRETNGRFVGSKACEHCHENSYKTWKKSAHAEAYATLAKLDPPRNFDPECISCHVVGWHPSKCFPYQSGYESDQKTRHLENVGCEDCHGPGQRHVAAEQPGADKTLQKKLRQAMVITKAEAADPRTSKQNCFSCHNGDNSPAFNFDTYWPLIKHHD